jgi:hypothetical protein
MALTKNTVSKSLAYIIVLLIGFCLGLLFEDFPGIVFKNEVDLGTCMSVLGLIATIYIMPYIVQKGLSRQENINSVVLMDLESINTDVVKLREIYVALKPSIKISKAKYIEITTLFKTISSEILSLNQELERQNKLPKFKKDVYDDNYTPTYELCTDMLVMNKKMDLETIHSANTALNLLCTSLRKYRYYTIA